MEKCIYLYDRERGIRGRSPGNFDQLVQLTPILLASVLYFPTFLLHSFSFEQATRPFVSPALPFVPPPSPPLPPSFNLQQER